MKACPRIVMVFLAAGLVFKVEDCPGASAQPMVNPATGLPLARGEGPSAVDLRTGLPRSAGTVASGRSSDPVPAAATAGSLLVQARQFMNQGRFEEALQCYLSFRAQAAKASREGPLVSALADWVELGQRYPRAKQALLEIRDRATREFVEGRGNAKQFAELVDINRALAEQDASFALFLGLERADAPLAQECYPWLEQMLVERGEYELCGRYVPDAQARLDTARRTLELGQSLAQQQAETRKESSHRLERMAQTNRLALAKSYGPDTSRVLHQSAVDFFAATLERLVEILAGAGRTAEAEQLRKQALEILDDPRLQRSISEVAMKVRQTQASRRPPPPPVLLEPRFAECPTLFRKDLAPPTASLQQWAPDIRPGHKPDLQAILSEAKDLHANDHFEESLQRHLWYHFHALEYEPEAQRGVRLSFALADWAGLARKYPRARAALLEIRDRHLQEFGKGAGTVALFIDTAAINQYIGHDRTTCLLFQHLHQQQPELARRAYAVAEDALVRQGEYALCGVYVGDGQERFRQHRENWERLARWENHVGQIHSQAQQRAEDHWTQQGQKAPGAIPRYRPPGAADNLLVKNTRQLMEILVRAGRPAEAEEIRSEALALVDDPRLRSPNSDGANETRQ